MYESRLFGTNGIRGVVNKNLTPEFALRVAGAIGTFFEGGRILLGRDGRNSGPMLAHAIKGGLMATGCSVFDCGMAPTPAIQYAVKHHEMDGGVIVTASHNPSEYNGFKVLGRDGVELSKDKEGIIEGLLQNGKTEWAQWNHIGKTTRSSNVTSIYIDAIKQHINTQSIKEEEFRVVVDPGNGVAALAAPHLLRMLGCNVISLNAIIDGSFPSRPSEPKPENLGDLVSTVKAVNANLGVAFDGDADRSIFVDETGSIHWGDRTFALIEKYFLKENPKELIVTAVSSSKLIEDIAEQFNSQVVWTKVGSIYISHEMKRINAKLGGEENGGVMYGPHQPVRDGTMTMALILEIMANEKTNLSNLLAELPIYHLEKEKVRCPNELKDYVLKEFIRQTSNLVADTTDGVKLRFDNGSSILIRPSGTEPLFRFYAEGKNQEDATTLMNEFKNQIAKIIEKKNVMIDHFPKNVLDP